MCRHFKIIVFVSTFGAALGMLSTPATNGDAQALANKVWGNLQSFFGQKKSLANFASRNMGLRSITVEYILNRVIKTTVKEIEKLTNESLTKIKATNAQSNKIIGILKSRRSQASTRWLTYNPHYNTHLKPESEITLETAKIKETCQEFEQIENDIRDAKTAVQQLQELRDHTVFKKLRMLNFGDRRSKRSMTIGEFFRSTNDDVRGIVAIRDKLKEGLVSILDDIQITHRPAFDAIKARLEQNVNMASLKKGTVQIGVAAGLVAFILLGAVTGGVGWLVGGGAVLTALCSGAVFYNVAAHVRSGELAAHTAKGAKLQTLADVAEGIRGVADAKRAEAGL